MASHSTWPCSDRQIYAPQGRKSSAMPYAKCWDHFSNESLDLYDGQGSGRSFYSRQTAGEVPSGNFQQCTPSSDPRAPSPSPYASPDELLNRSDPYYPSSRDTQDHPTSSSTEKGRRTRTEGYQMQNCPYPLMPEGQSWKQSLGYPGQQQRFEQYYLSSSQPTHSDSYSTDLGNSYQTQHYSSSFAPSSYLDNNSTPSMASPSRPSYLPFPMPVARPSIVVDEAQDDHICSQKDNQSSLYQDCLGTNVSSVSRHRASVGLVAHRSSTRTPNRNHRKHRTHNDMTDQYDLEESAEGFLNVPRAPRRGQREDDSQPRRRHLTPEGREHAKDVRRVQACKECRRRKIKVCFIWRSGFALLLILPKS